MGSSFFQFAVTYLFNQTNVYVQLLNRLVNSESIQKIKLKFMDGIYKQNYNRLGSGLRCLQNEQIIIN